jgi:hypothetical protein
MAGGFSQFLGECVEVAASHIRRAFAMADWSRLLSTARSQWSAAAVIAETFIEKFGTASQAVRLACDDGNEYVVKSRDAGRMIVTDQIVGRIGIASGAPVGTPALVEVPMSLIQAEPEMAHMSAGIAHGSRWIPGCTQGGVDHCSTNRARFADLALLYGWAIASDHQFIYENDAPRLVHSVDHGHFFAGSTGWTVDTLSNAPTAEPDPTLISGCTLTDQELDDAKEKLAVVDDDAIAGAVASPPEDWGITQDERLAVAEYLAIRRDMLFGGAEEAEEGEEEAE